jgi:hypothetical protein
MTNGIVYGVPGRVLRYRTVFTKTSLVERFIARFRLVQKKKRKQKLLFSARSLHANGAAGAWSVEDRYPVPAEPTRISYTVGYRHE